MLNEWCVFLVSFRYRFIMLSSSTVFIGFISWILFDFFGIVDHEYNDWMGLINQNQRNVDNPSIDTCY